MEIKINKKLIHKNIENIIKYKIYGKIKLSF